MGGWLVCLSLGAFGFGCHAIFAATNFSQGWSIGLDGGWSHQIYGFTALAIDVVGVGICSCAAGLFRRRGERAATRKAMALVYTSAAFSLLMFYGFNAANRIEPSRQAVARHAAELSAATQTKAIKQAVLGNTQEFLESEIRRAADAGRAKGVTEDQRDAAGDQAKYFTERLKAASDVEVKPEPIATDPDAMATNLAETFGLRVSTVQGLLAVGMSALLMLLSSSTLKWSFEYWPREGQPEDQVRPPAPILVERQAPQASKPRPYREPLPADDWKGAQAGIEVVEKTEQLTQWVRQATKPEPKSRTRSTECYDHYKRYAALQGWNLMSHRAFGQTMQQLNEAKVVAFPSERTSMAHLYCGRRLDYQALEATREAGTRETERPAFLN